MALADPRTELETAKKLGTDALNLYDAGDYDKALAKFDEADGHARVPTLDLFAARCLDKLHRLLEAKQRYDDVVRALLPVGSSQKWIDAQEDAKKELAALGNRIPTLTVHTAGAGDRKVSLSIDGHDVPMLDAATELNPGPHAVVVLVSGKQYTKQISLQEGDRPTVEIAIDPERPVGPPAVETPPPSKGVSPLVVAGGVTLGVGLAGLVVWGGTGGAAIAKASSQACKSGVCAGDVGGLNRLRTASMVSFYVGLPVAAIGGTLLIVSAATSGGGKATVRAGADRVSVEATF